MSTHARPGFVSLFGLDPASYRSHPIHAPERTYVETNCYTDILIELLHARGHEPLAAMGCTVRMDFEGDQWTFFKPFVEDLELLFGVDVHEMQPYRPLPQQAAEQIAQGRTLIVELDSWYLPDTAATSYRNEHIKTSVAIEAIDPAGERLRYFHATGLYELTGEDYRGVFRLGRAFSEDVLPPYTELVRFDAAPPLRDEDLRDRARTLLARPSRTDDRPPTRLCVLASNSSATCHVCSMETRANTTPTPLQPCGWPARPLRSPHLRPNGFWARTPLSPRRHFRGSSRAARSSPSGSLGDASSIPAKPCLRLPRHGTRQWVGSMTHSIDPQFASTSSALASVDAYELSDLTTGWMAARSAPQAHVDAASIDALSWIPARVPGTAAGALHDAGLPRTTNRMTSTPRIGGFALRSTHDRQCLASG